MEYAVELLVGTVRLTVDAESEEDAVALALQDAIARALDIFCSATVAVET